MRVLLTGAAGFIGSRLSAYLAPRHDLVLGDLDPPDSPGWRRLDVTRLAEVEAACRGVDAVVHLAIASRHPAARPVDDKVAGVEHLRRGGG